MSIKFVDAHITAESFSRAARSGNAPTEEVAQALARLEAVALATAQVLVQGDGDTLLLMDALINEALSCAEVRRRYLAKLDGEKKSVVPNQKAANA